MSIHAQIEQAIESSFNFEFMQLENESHMHSGPATESHFKLTLVSEDFAELSKVKRQQAVYKALKEIMPQFHALALHTYSPAEWAQNEQAIPASPKCASAH